MLELVPSYPPYRTTSLISFMLVIFIPHLFILLSSFLISPFFSFHSSSLHHSSLSTFFSSSFSVSTKFIPVSDRNCVNVPHLWRCYKHIFFMLPVSWKHEPSFG
ncbi:hypothetical protein L873DRAFT_1023171 [Choiromyces venosus 120613-1]|uniref:Uncharacterized protein n=1 Tax=Choiromyces venosus 120613-1 TaxID=1336337 RepID=A0A3N4IS43_9PEZI|nr:hypothetical protein L873DRAFT_1023171 [Choiromyces venosus 120613-1]